jgi:hypothetical protein
VFKLLSVVAMLSFLMATVTGCQTTTVTVGIQDRACLNFNEIEPRAGDSFLTKEDLRIHNAGYRAICERWFNPGVATNTTCTAFAPIKWSRRDTNETIRAIKQHNAVWERECDVKQN